MSKFYTGNGDKGKTSLPGYNGVSKDDPIIVAIGSVDELNSNIGLAIQYIHDEKIKTELLNIQNDLFMLGADLACTLRGETKNKLDERQVSRLAGNIKELGDFVGDLNEFVLPGGGKDASHLHILRSITRRVETNIVNAANTNKYKLNENALAYINRLSSYFFVAALYLNKINGIKEIHPHY
ncbi:MAG: cob(I)yrinic acid a,c-diamide adenosyltransferase [Candidatus Micrarchaeia archaeon]